MASYRKHKSGWEYRVRYKQGGEYLESAKRGYRTKKEAEIAAAKVEEKLKKGWKPSNDKILLGDVAKEWLEFKQKNVKDSTFEQIEVIVRLHILPTFGYDEIASIPRRRIQIWIDTYVDKKDKKGNPRYSYGSCIKYLSVLKSIFHYAKYEMNILNKNETDGLRVPVKDKVQLKTKKVKYYELDELNQLLDYMKEYKHQRFSEYRIYYVLMYFLSRTGLRISEALALTWDDLNDDVLSINKQTSRNNNNDLAITTLKTDSSEREVKLEEDVLKELKKFKITQREMFLKYENFKRSEDNIIFQNYLGNYLTPSTVRDSIRDYCKKAGVEYKGTHGFRHTHAVQLLEAGANIKYVADRLGHKTIKTTADTYLHITKRIEEDELKKLTAYTKRKA